MSEQAEIEEEFVWRVRALLARHGKEITSITSTGRKAEIYGLVVIEELPNRAVIPGFAVYDYVADCAGAIYSDHVGSLEKYSKREHKWMLHHTQRLRSLMILDDLADV